MKVKVFKECFQEFQYYESEKVFILKNRSGYSSLLRFHEMQSHFVIHDPERPNKKKNIQTHLKFWLLKNNLIFSVLCQLFNKIKRVSSRVKRKIRDLTSADFVRGITRIQHPVNETEMCSLLGF